MPAEAAVSCHAVVKIFESDTGDKVQALRGIDLSVRPGTVAAIVGPSGSGKTSLLRLIGALDRPSAGEVTLAGRSLSPLSSRQLRLLRLHDIGFVAQRPAANLLANASAAQQVRRTGRRRGATKADAEELLARLGLEHRRWHLPSELSGGEQQRVAFARAAVGAPTMIIADEPTAELDSHATRAVCTVMRELADQGQTIIVATHDPLVTDAADHVVTIRDGAVQSEEQEGRQRAVIDSAGRLQLPAEIVDWFPDRRVQLDYDPHTRELRVRRG